MFFRGKQQITQWTNKEKEDGGQNPIKQTNLQYDLRYFDLDLDLQTSSFEYVGKNSRGIWCLGPQDVILSLDQVFRKRVPYTDRVASY